MQCVNVLSPSYATALCRVFDRRPQWDPSHRAVHVSVTGRTAPALLPSTKTETETREVTGYGMAKD